MFHKVSPLPKGNVNAKSYQNKFVNVGPRAYKSQTGLKLQDGCHDLIIGHSDLIFSRVHPFPMGNVKQCFVNWIVDVVFRVYTSLIWLKNKDDCRDLILGRIDIIFNRVCPLLKGNVYANFHQNRILNIRSIVYTSLVWLKNQDGCCDLILARSDVIFNRVDSLHKGNVSAKCHQNQIVNIGSSVYTSMAWLKIQYGCCSLIRRRSDLIFNRDCTH